MKGITSRLTSNQLSKRRTGSVRSVRQLPNLLLELSDLGRVAHGAHAQPRVVRDVGSIRLPIMLVHPGIRLHQCDCRWVDNLLATTIVLTSVLLGMHVHELGPGASTLYNKRGARGLPGIRSRFLDELE